MTRQGIHFRADPERLPPIKEASIMSDSIDAKNAKILIVDDFPANLNLLGVG